MVLPSDLNIKQEKEEFEHETLTRTDYDVKVKVEVESFQVYEENDWCIDNKTLFKRNEECERPTKVVDYETLTEFSAQVCLYCKKIFSNIYTLICHNLIHLKLQLIPIKILRLKRVSEFPVCQKQEYNKKSSLKEHLHIHSKSSRRKLKIIGNVDFKKTTSLQQCNHCNIILPYKRWHSHQAKVHGKEKFECVPCNKQFKTARCLKQHNMYVHLQQQRSYNRKEPLAQKLKCSECPKEFDHKTKLTLHRRFTHCEKVKCEICKTVMKKNNLSNHMRRLHFGGKHACHCGKKFKSPSYLKVHVNNAHSKS